MTKNSALDEHIKKQFGDYSPDVPPHIWENIIAQKDKRKPLGFWFKLFKNKTGLLIIGMIIVGASLIIFKNINTESINNTTVTTENESTTNKTSNKISPEINNDIIGTPDMNSINESIKTNPGMENGDVNNIKVPVNAQSNTIQNNRSSLSETNNDSHFNKRNKSRTQKAASSMLINNPDAVSEETIAVSENAFFISRILLYPELLQSENSILPAIKNSNNPHINIPCPEAEKNAAGNKRYFELYGGPDYAFRSITDTGNSVYAKKRKESTSFRSAFSIGLRYTRVFNNGMSFRTGINYSQINEKFKIAQGNIIQLIYITNSNGDTTGSYTTTGTRYKTTFNKFRTIDMPLLIGYELGNGRLHANFNAGAVVNIYSWQKGDVLDTSYNPVTITTGKETSPYQFKSNVGIGFMGGISVYYKLTDKWHILAEPYFRYNFSAANKAELTIKQKYNTAGIRLGIRLDF